VPELIDHRPRQVTRFRQPRAAAQAGLTAAAIGRQLPDEIPAIPVRIAVIPERGAARFDRPRQDIDERGMQPGGFLVAHTASRT